MLKLVIFDFDGVIADSEPAHFEMFKEIFEEEGFFITWEEYKDKYLGYTDQECFTHLLKDYGRNPDPKEIDELIQRKSVKFDQYIKDNCVILPGVRELLQNLKDNNIICSICSGALRGEVDFILKQSHLAEYFTTIVTAEDISNGKPHPEGYRLALEKTNTAINAENPVQTDECIVIEDSLWGIQAAQRAQMKCLGVETTYPAAMIKQADKVIPNLTHTSTSHLDDILKG